jgi:hypothetical protein
MYSATSSDTDDFEEAPPFFFGPFPFFPMLHLAMERSMEIGDGVRVKSAEYAEFKVTPWCTQRAGSWE